VEGAASAQHFIKDDTEREDIGLRVGFLAGSLLRRHVRGGPEDSACGRQQFSAGSGMRFTRIRTRSGKILGETEVEDLDDTLGRDLDVCGFQIAVNDAMYVCCRE